MAKKSILEIVRTVAPRLGILRPNTATGSNDLQIQQLVELANEDGKELAARIPWQVLVRECQFITVAQSDQGKLTGERFTPPSAANILDDNAGFSYILKNTIFNRTTHTKVGGPISPPVWQAVQAGTAVSGFFAEYRLRGGNLFLYPAPANDLCSFEYVTENWVSNVTADAFRSGFQADDDYPLLDSRLIELGLKWRWKATKGLDYAEDFKSYESAVADAMAREKTARPADMAACGTDELEPMITASKGNWPL